MQRKIRLYTPAEYLLLGLCTSLLTYMLSGSLEAVGVSFVLFAVFIIVVEIITFFHNG